MLESSLNVMRMVDEGTDWTSPDDEDVKMTNWLLRTSHLKMYNGSRQPVRGKTGRID